MFGTLRICIKVSSRISKELKKHSLFLWTCRADDTDKKLCVFNQNRYGNINTIINIKTPTQILDLYKNSNIALETNFYKYNGKNVIYNIHNYHFLILSLISIFQ